MAMRRLALQGSVRTLLTRLHRWSGLTILALLFVAGATGTVLTFRDGIERWASPRLHVVAPAAERVPLQEVIDNVERRYPDARVSTMTLRSEIDPAASTIVYLAKRPGSPPGELAAGTVFVDPYIGEVLGARNRQQPIFSRDNVVPMLVRLHSSLLLATPGVWLMGSAAIVWLLTSVAGLALAWPMAWRHVTGWRETVSVRSGEGAYKLTYDLHRTLGVALLPIWLVLAFTSVYLSFPNMVRAATSRASTITPVPSRQAPPIERPAVTPAVTPTVTPDQAIAAAVAHVPGATPFGVTRDFLAGWYSVRLIVPGDVNPSGNSQVYVDFSTGEVVAQRLVTTVSAGTTFLFWQFPLHSGDAFGLPGQLAVALSGIALCVMCATGLYVWWRGWIPRRRRARELKKENV